MLTSSDLQQISRSHELDFGAHPVISSTGGGDVSETYIVEGNGTKTFIKKIPIKNLPRQAEKPHETAFEYLDFQEEIVEQLAYAVPAVAAFRAKTTGKKFHISSKMHVLLAYPAVAGTPKSDTQVSLAMVKSIARSLLHLHTAQPKFNDLVGREKLQQYRDIGFNVLNSPIWKFLTKVPLLKHFSPDLFSALSHIARKNVKLAQAVRGISTVSICHNDLKPKNVLWQDSGGFWIIDWDAVGLFDVAADHLDTGLSWATHFADGKLKFTPEKMAAFLQEYPIHDMEKFENSLNLVTVKWCYWLIFCMRRLFLFQGEYEKNIWNIKYAISVILFLAQANIEEILLQDEKPSDLAACNG